MFDQFLRKRFIKLHGEGEPHQADIYRCESCAGLVTWNRIRSGDVCCGGRLVATNPTKWEAFRLLSASEDHLMYTLFDPNRAEGGATKLWIASTQLCWEALKVDPGVISTNSSVVQGRFIPIEEIVSTERIAVVAFGPSLKETWPELNDYRTIITCSGAHKFLLEKGIIPTFHVESDPRIHKVDMLGEPHPQTVYLVASICHPRYLAKLTGFRVLLWHLLFEERVVYDLVPRGDWILTGGNTVGPRAIKIARLLGYTNLHMYGFDGSGKHAAEHANPVPEAKYRPCHFDGKTYITTENLFTHVDLLFKDLDTIPDASFTFHGDGLIQAISKKWQYNYKEGYPLAVVKDD